MRITQQKVQAVSDHAEKLSCGAFGLQAIGGDIGYGARYTDRRRDRPWTGPQAARRAACYYLGVIDAFDSGALVADLPQGVTAVRAALGTAGWNQGEYETGAHDARRYQERQREG